MTAGKVLVVGRNSFLARSFLAATGLGHRITAISHQDIAGFPLDGVTLVVNFACAPGYVTGSYQPHLDMDRVLVDRLEGADIHYLMFSSRMVYRAGENMPLHEGSSTEGQGFYGKNKLVSEAHVSDRMGKACTILRLANIFGFEPGRRTFMGRALGTLRDEDRICLDIGGDAYRDFLPVEIFAAILDRLMIERPPGTFNLGSGVATGVGDMARWTIEGFGRGQIEVRKEKEDNSFVMSVDKLREIVGIHCSADDIRASCINLGKQLGHA